MLIGLIADTHVCDREDKIPDSVFKIFKSVDLIIHAGDLTSQEVIGQLKKIAPLTAIQGNMDRAYNLKLPKTEIITVDDLKIGITHGEVYPRGDEQQLYYLALEMGVDILITGHSHQSSIKKIKEILLLNPGSPTVPTLADPTVMLLDIINGEVSIEVIKLGKPVCKALNFSKK
ncbi:MAG: YfcE family phosphodiesterase [Methanobacteriaceae archaeon]|jgi:putative phosphoesterase|nr:YfcE family phosphodiesterase [Candidatus Methanorudis spinitermitis]